VIVLTLVLFAEDIWQLRVALKGGLMGGLGLAEREFVVQAPTATTTSADVDAVVPGSSQVRRCSLGPLFLRPWSFCSVLPP